ncbi:23S rRNA (pseudouridine(1915)-N(3))-methyltransferase RlmH [Salinisphaera sp. Q1T1-3]|uniref:23S rRNA (pseudouridine(1915)-N(3))-methyltransferase RlmH n=1 Tax=Salinisphaera sp. Q1T1-3 TaxID=2321229 RepID=UPI000E73CC10|nr:23S rRNA (pseudouridine(1915)-N(3))-methyltransferase RlmH [Salinisphaera sp. Q1T1-3]RJS93531.1 23S rRNA (pseudouridine(1915)-N(3))-methyltransferase RlmH [Salinisphaera sp. Q1T1-3]
MRIRLIAVGRRMPKWVTTAYDDYAQRLPRECRLELVEIAPGDRKSGDTARAIAAEDERMLKAIGRDDHVIALAVDGKPWQTKTLAEDLRGWLGDGRDRCLLVGGPDGLGPASLAAAHTRRALSALTLPHPLVRVILAEQLFRAHSILIGHPYHRA